MHPLVSVTFYELNYTVFTFYNSYLTRHAIFVFMYYAFEACPNIACIPLSNSFCLSEMLFLTNLLIIPACTDHLLNNQVVQTFLQKCYLYSFLMADKLMKRAFSEEEEEEKNQKPVKGKVMSSFLIVSSCNHMQGRHVQIVNTGKMQINTRIKSQNLGSKPNHPHRPQSCIIL